MGSGGDENTLAAGYYIRFRREPQPNVSRLEPSNTIVPGSGIVVLGRPYAMLLMLSTKSGDVTNTESKGELVTENTSGTS